MSYVKKKIMLKGDASGVLTIEGNENTRVSIEWLKGEMPEPVILFATPEIFSTVKDGLADIPAKAVSAAAAVEKLSARGQLMPFNWPKALSGVNMSAFIRNSHAEIKIDEPPANVPLEIPNNTQNTQEKKEETVIQTGMREEFVCPAKKQPKEIRAFTSAFPDAVWYEHEYTSTGSTRKYMTGVIYENGRAVKTAAAVPGRFSVKPPPWLEGFTMFMLNDDKMGYWVSVSSIENVK